MLAKVFGLIITLLRLGGILLLVYCVMKLITPTNAFVTSVGVYIEKVLVPFRALLYKLIPKLRDIPVDMSPVALWLAIEIVTWILDLFF